MHPKILNNVNWHSELELPKLLEIIAGPDAPTVEPTTEPDTVPDVPETVPTTPPVEPATVPGPGKQPCPLPDESECPMP